MKLRSIIFMGMCGVTLITLSGCDSLRSTFGLDHYQAEAFDVPTNPPLTLPPDYNLRPPAPGVQPTYAVKSSDMVQRTLGLPASEDHGSQHILSTTHTAHTPPENIREVVDREAEEESTLSGKMNAHYQGWKAEAKKNIGSISK